MVLILNGMGTSEQVIKGGDKELQDTPFYGAGFVVSFMPLARSGKDAIVRRHTRMVKGNPETNWDAVSLEVFTKHVTGWENVAMPSATDPKGYRLIAFNDDGKREVAENAWPFADKMASIILERAGAASAAKDDELKN